MRARAARQERVASVAVAEVVGDVVDILLEIGRAGEARIGIGNLGKRLCQRWWQEGSAILAEPAVLVRVLFRLCHR